MGEVPNSNVQLHDVLLAVWLHVSIQPSCVVAQQENASPIIECLGLQLNHMNDMYSLGRSLVVWDL